MKLDDSRRSDNVEDDRGSGLGRRGAGIGIGTLVIVVIGYFMGVSPATLLSLLEGGAQDSSQTAPSTGTPVSNLRKRSPGGFRAGRARRDGRCVGRVISKPTASDMLLPSWSCSAVRCHQPAAWQVPPPGLSTAPAIRACTSI